MIEKIIGASLGVKFVNGMFKPKFGLINYIVGFLFVIIDLLFCCLLVYGILNYNLEFIIYPLIGIFSFTYFILIIPVFQNKNNFYIEFVNDATLDGFILLYKNKKVKINYSIDKLGKILFANNEDKLSCLSYEDGSKMSNLTKYKIINYFTKWLHDNNLLSDEVTVTMEKL